MSLTTHPGVSRLIIAAVGLSASTYYYQAQSSTARGRTPSAQTTRGCCPLSASGEAASGMVDNSVVLKAVESLLEGEFVCYGHRAMTSALRRKGFRINHKKLYRLMKEASLLSSIRPGRLSKRLLAPRGTVEATRPWQHLQMDIKYVYIHGEQRWAYLLTVIDVFTRCLVAQMFDRSIRANDVIRLLTQTAPTWTSHQWCETERIRLRTDHGSQFIANDLVPVLEKLNIEHEFTHPALRVAFPKKMPSSNPGTASSNLRWRAALSSLRLRKLLKPSNDTAIGISMNVCTAVYATKHQKNLHNNTGNTIHPKPYPEIRKPCPAFRGSNHHDYH
jgi:putative transposase